LPLFPAVRRLALFFSALALVGVLASACGRDEHAEAPPPRPVRAIVAEKGELGQTVTLTGQILAEKEITLAFRIGGRMIERNVDVGDAVKPDQVVAKLDPQNELNVLRSARAALSAAEGRLAQEAAQFDRQQQLLDRGFTTRVLFDQAQQAFNTARAQVDDAKAQLEIAQDRVSYTELKAGVAGTVTARRAEAGEVVQPGQPIYTVARDSGWDAVFDVPAQLLRTAPTGAPISLALTDDPSVSAKGLVRQVDPQADPVTRTFRVRVTVDNPPAAMRLGATVTGRISTDTATAIIVPATALTSTAHDAAVWVVDPKDLTVKLQPVEILRFDPGTAVIASGLEPGAIVVTAGVQALHPGQKVRLLGAPA
jgi:membrane fusion protein, multidrug efflux system